MTKSFDRNPLQRDLGPRFVFSHLCCHVFPTLSHPGLLFDGLGFNLWLKDLASSVRNLCFCNWLLRSSKLQGNFQDTGEEHCEMLAIFCFADSHPSISKENGRKLIIDTSSCEHASYRHPSSWAWSWREISQGRSWSWDEDGKMIRKTFKNKRIKKKKN